MIVNPEYAENLLNPPDPEDFEEEDYDEEDDYPSPDDLRDMAIDNEINNY